MTDSTQNTPFTDLAALAERIGAAIANVLPGDSGGVPGGPIDAAIRQALQSADLVPRAELDAHLAVLQRLEAKVSELEARLDAGSSSEVGNG